MEVIRSEQVKIRYCKTSAQLADMMTKHFTKPEVWSALLHICQMYKSKTPVPDRDPNGGSGQGAAKRKKAPKQKAGKPLRVKDDSAVAQASGKPVAHGSSSSSAPRARSALCCLTQTALVSLSSASSAPPPSSGGLWAGKQGGGKELGTAAPVQQPRLQLQARAPASSTFLSFVRRLGWGTTYQRNRMASSSWDSAPPAAGGAAGGPPPRSASVEGA